MIIPEEGLSFPKLCVCCTAPSETSVKITLSKKSAVQTNPNYTFSNKVSISVPYCRRCASHFPWKVGQAFGLSAVIFALGGFSLAVINPPLALIFVIAPLGVVLRNQIVKRRVSQSCACEGPAAWLVLGGSDIAFKNEAYQQLMEELNPSSAYAKRRLIL